MSFLCYLGHNLNELTASFEGFNEQSSRRFRHQGRECLLRRYLTTGLNRLLRSLRFREARLACGPPSAGKGCGN